MKMSDIADLTDTERAEVDATLKGNSAVKTTNGLARVAWVAALVASLVLLAGFFLDAAAAYSGIARTILLVGLAAWAVFKGLTVWLGISVTKKSVDAIRARRAASPSQPPLGP